MAITLYCHFFLCVNFGRLLYMDYRYLLTFFMGFLITGLGLLVLFKARRQPVQAIYGVFVLMVAAWSFALGFYYFSGNATGSLFWAKCVYFSGALIPSFFLLFSNSFPEKKIQFSDWQILLLFLPNAVLGYLYFATSSMIQAIGFSDPSARYFILGANNWLFDAQFIAYFTWAYITLYRKWVAAKGRLHAQLTFILLGTLVGTAFAFIFNIALPDFWRNSQYVWLGPELTIVWLLSIAYSIIAHHLFDIRVIIKKTFVYSVLLAFVLAVYAVIIFGFTTFLGATGKGFSVRELIPNIIAAIAIAIGFEPIRQRLEKFADKFLYVGQYDPDEVMQKLGASLASSASLTEALHSMMEALIEAMRLEFSIFFILKGKQNETKINRIEAIGISKEKLTEAFSEKLIVYFKTLSEPIIREELERDIEDNEEIKEATEGQIATFMQSISAAVAFPVFVKEKLIGIMMMSEKKSGDMFSDQDLRLLNIASLQTASAIEKERLYEEDQMKSEFVSIASHELLTPTAAIEGYLSMILDEKIAKVDPIAQKYLIRVYDSSRRLSRLVKDLLNVSRIESGKLQIVARRFDLVELIKSAQEELQAKAFEKNLKLEFTPSVQDPNVWADPERIHQVIYNLVGNAIKYSKQGAVRVAMSEENGLVKTSVTDTGIGIPAKDLPHLFEKFFRVQTPETTDIQGTGLGLYISKNIIDLSGGKINVSTEYGKGSVFSFTLPKDKPDDDGRKTPPEIPSDDLASAPQGPEIKPETGAGSESTTLQPEPIPPVRAPLENLAQHDYNRLIMK